jgi:hypothetical protein
MNRPDDRWSDADPDPGLSRLIQDAAAGVEPTDRLEELRARTSQPSRRPWLLATGGAVVAAAAVVTAVALVGGNDPVTVDPDPFDPATSATSPSESEPPSSPDASPTVGTSTVGAYYVGDTPAGPRLYREFRSLPGDPFDAALAALTTAPSDPDYRTAWQEDWLLGVTFDGTGAEGLITVEVDPSVRQRPDGISEAEAGAAVQQVVYTLQGAVQDRAPVQFVTEGNPIDQVLGVPTSEPLANAPVLDTLSHVSLITPEEGATVSGRFDVEGVANSFEANVPWTLRSGEDVVEQGFFTATGFMDDRLFPFSGPVDVSSLDPGSYTLIVETDDPTGGAEGPGAFSDSRTIVIE